MRVSSGADEQLLNRVYILLGNLINMAHINVHNIHICANTHMGDIISKETCINILFTTLDFMSH